MHRTNRYLASLFLAAALAGPLSMMAAPRPADAAVQIRVYDRPTRTTTTGMTTKPAWGVYLTNNHRSRVEYRRAKRGDQVCLLAMASRSSTQDSE